MSGPGVGNCQPERDQFGSVLDDPQSTMVEREWRHASSWPGGTADTRSSDAIPGYELIEQLGRGGMGVVWKARQVGLNQVVALRLFSGGQRVGTNELIRFLAEAEAVATVKHPHILQV